MNKIIILLIPCMLFADILMISDSGTDPRSSGMRNSDLAIHRQNGGFYSNPAVMAEQESIYFSSFYHNYFSDISLTSVKYSHPDLILKDVSTGFSLTAINYGKFSDIESGDSYNPYEMLITISQGYRIKKIMTGLNLKYAYSSISEYNADALLIDIGLMYKFFNERLVIAGGLFNVGFQISEYYDTTENVGISMKTAAAYSLDKLPLSISLQYERFEDEKSRLAVGMELQAKDNITVRGGYDLNGIDKQTGTNNNTEKFSGLSFGTTLFLNDFDFDISYMLNGELEDEFGFSVGMNISNFIMNK
ncbi:MAG: hypothetical protein JXN63_06555 [Candidatus Delongbacteria bacterium]|nr:hypothetical protein [Candidatus Delongbacteria bacterium]